MILQKYTMGMGDRFAHQGKAQLQAIFNAQAAGIDLYPTWNKSFREHSIVKSRPEDLRAQAVFHADGHHTELGGGWQSRGQ